MNLKKLAAAAIVATGALGAGLAQAHPDVRWSVSIGLPLPVPVFVQAAPVYAETAPVYVQPAPVYHGRPVVVQPPRYVTRWDRDGDGIPNRYDRHDNRWDERGHDRDHDGIPNRYDRYPDRPSRH